MTCTVCGDCRHDHHGWRHGFEPEPMTREEAEVFLSQPENYEVVVAAMERVSRERPAWWVAFLEREGRIRGGGLRRIFM